MGQLIRETTWAVVTSAKTIIPMVAQQGDPRAIQLQPGDAADRRSPHRSPRTWPGWRRGGR